MRGIFGLVLAGVLGLSQPAAAACDRAGKTVICVDDSGGVTITMETGDGWIRLDNSGRVRTVTNYSGGSIVTEGGNVWTTTTFKEGSVTVGSNQGTGKVWSETQLRAGAVEIRQSEHDGEVLSELQQSVGGGYVLYTATDAEGNTSHTTCGPGLDCR